MRNSAWTQNNAGTWNFLFLFLDELWPMHYVFIHELNCSPSAIEALEKLIFFRQFRLYVLCAYFFFKKSLYVLIGQCAYKKWVGWIDNIEYQTLFSKLRATKFIYRIQKRHYKLTGLISDSIPLFRVHNVENIRVCSNTV